MVTGGHKEGKKRGQKKRAKKEGKKEGKKRGQNFPIAKLSEKKSQNYLKYENEPKYLKNRIFISDQSLHTD